MWRRKCRDCSEAAGVKDQSVLSGVVPGARESLLLYMDAYLRGNVSIDFLAGELEGLMKQSHGYSFLGRELEGELFELGEYYFYHFQASKNARVKNRSRLYVSILKVCYKLTGEPLITEDEVRRQVNYIYNNLFPNGERSAQDGRPVGPRRAEGTERESGGSKPARRIFMDLETKEQKTTAKCASRFKSTLIEGLGTAFALFGAFALVAVLFPFINAGQFRSDHGAGASMPLAFYLIGSLFAVGCMGIGYALSRWARRIRAIEGKLRGRLT